MNFLQNPFQKKYIPVLIALLLGVAATAVTHGVKDLVVMGVLALFQYLNADKPLTPFYLQGYIVLTAITGALAAYMLFAGAFSAAVVACALCTLPLSILLTRKHV
jgi:hypothetical protein